MRGSAIYLAVAVVTGGLMTSAVEAGNGHRHWHGGWRSQASSCWPWCAPFAIVGAALSVPAAVLGAVVPPFAYPYYGYYPYPYYGSPGYYSPY